MGIDGLLFEIIDGDKHYRIYGDGRVEGLGKDASVANHFSYHYNLQLYQAVLYLEAKREAAQLRKEGMSTEEKRKLLDQFFVNTKSVADSPVNNLTAQGVLAQAETK